MILRLNICSVKHLNAISKKKLIPSKSFIDSIEIKSNTNQNKDKTKMDTVGFEPKLNFERLLLVTYYKYPWLKATVDINQENSGPKSNHKPFRLPKLPRGKITKNYKS